MGPGCCLCWYKNSSFSAPPPPALHPGLLRYKTVASLPLPHQRMHSGRYPLLNSNPSRWACSLFSTDGLHAKVSPSGRAVFSVASVRSCSLRRLFGCVKWRWKPARNNPLGSNLRKTRQLAVYKVVGGGRGGDGRGSLISHRALTHPNTRTAAFKMFNGGSNEIAYPNFTQVLSALSINYHIVDHLNRSR